MLKEIVTMKVRDWSLNLEDSYYEDHEEEALEISVAAVKQTAAGCFVNLVTPGKFGDPNDWFIPKLKGELQHANVEVKAIEYIDECGCGGFVTRVFL